MKNIITMMILMLMVFVSPALAVWEKDNSETQNLQHIKTTAMQDQLNYFGNDVYDTEYISSNGSEYLIISYLSGKLVGYKNVNGEWELQQSITENLPVFDGAPSVSFFRFTAPDFNIDYDAVVIMTDHNRAYLLEWDNEKLWYIKRLSWRCGPSASCSSFPSNLHATYAPLDGQEYFIAGNGSTTNVNGKFIGYKLNFTSDFGSIMERDDSYVVGLPSGTSYRVEYFEDSNGKNLVLGTQSGEFKGYTWNNIWTQNESVVSGLNNATLATSNIFFDGTDLRAISIGYRLPIIAYRWI